MQDVAPPEEVLLGLSWEGDYVGSARLLRPWSDWAIENNYPGLHNWLQNEYEGFEHADHVTIENISLVPTIEIYQNEVSKCSVYSQVDATTTVYDYYVAGAEELV